MKTFLTLCALILAFSSQAQWTTDTSINTLVADSDGGDMKALGSSTGQTFVVFWKVVAPPTNYELRMQVLDTDGNQLLGADGALVSNTIPMSTFTVIWNIVMDAYDNIYIGVTGTGGGDPAYAFKLDAAGNHLWGSEGINVGNGFAVTIMPMSSGDAVVSWFPGGSSVMQRYDSNGSEVWGSTQTIFNGSNDTVPADFFELASGEFVLVFHSLLGGISSNLYAQLFDGNGVPEWNNPTQLSNQTTVFNRSYGGVEENGVVYYGYFGSTGTRFDSFLQRINTDGSLPWGINGSDFDTNQTNYEMDTRVAFVEGSQDIWAVCSYTNTSQSEKGEYVQKFDKTTGDRGLSDTAKEVFAISSDDNVHAGVLQLKEGSPLFLHKSGMDNGASPTELGVVYLDTNGEFVWPEESRPVATFSANKSRIQYTGPVNNQSVAVFIEEKAGAPKIYAQNFLDEELSVPDINVSSFISFKNPIDDFLELKSQSAINSIQVFDLIGRSIYAEDIIGKNELRIHTSKWNSGLYLVHLELMDNQAATLKLLKL